jgi:cell division protein FtsI/penicillin-binding protein 2
MQKSVFYSYLSVIVLSCLLFSYLIYDYFNHQIIYTSDYNVTGVNRPVNPVYSKIFIARRIFDGKYQVILTSADSNNQFTNVYAIMYSPTIGTSTTSGNIFGSAADAKNYALSAFTSSPLNKAYDLRKTSASMTFNAFSYVPYSD